MLFSYAASATRDSSAFAAPLLRPASSLLSSSIFAPAAIVHMQATPEPRILTEENAIDVLNECMADIGTMFGTEASSRGVGITGEVEFVELDGPILVVRLKGRFWHQRTRVVERVESYVLERIPECVEVVIEDAACKACVTQARLRAGVLATFFSDMERPSTLCHIVELGPRINYITGENGSGKSAVLTALTMPDKGS